MLDLPDSYARKARLLGFEPNAEEHRRLVERDTDPIRAGRIPPRFSSEIYLDYALWDQEGEETLTMTTGPGTPTLMGEADPAVTRRMFRAGEQTSFYETALVPTGHAVVKVRRLDDIVARDDTVDYLKLDVEGGEIRVLRGAERMLSERRVLVIRSEFAAVSYYENHPLLGDQHLVLHRHGFRMIDIQDTMARYTRDLSKIPSSEDRRLLQSGDAVYVLDPDRIDLAGTQLQRMSAVVLGLGFRSLAISLIRDAGLLDVRTIEEIEDALARVPPRKKALARWHEFPSRVANLGRRLR